ncbi:MAG: hypothetical protein PHR16_18070, partial [Methylovulum sp.]|nr:hypothetical protein [Methylovulum sp.]
MSIYIMPALAMPGLPYEQMPGEMQVEQSDKNRVPQVEFNTDPFLGATLLKETDYVGEGQFPLEFTRYQVSPRLMATEDCDKYSGLGDWMNGWSHNYSSCLINHLSYGGPASNRFITVCTMGICTLFDENLKPRHADVRDTLVRNGAVNGNTYPWVYTHFKSGIREAYNDQNWLVARFDRSGIEHRISFVTVTDSNNFTSTRVGTISHVPSGRRLSFQYEADQLVSITDPGGAVYRYFPTDKPNSTVFPPANARTTPLGRQYEISSLRCNSDGSAGSLPYTYYRYLSKTSEQGNTLLDIEFMGGEDAKFCQSIGHGNSIWYTQISKAGHNAQPLLQTHYTAFPYDENNYKPFNITDQFADTDISAYRSLNTDRTFKNVNGDNRLDGYAIWRPASVTSRCADCKDDYASYTWNPTNGDPDTRTDYLGRLTKFINDNNGLPLTETQAQGTAEARTITRTWDSRFPLKTSEKIGNIIHEWRYNGQGHAIKDIVH